MQVAQALIKRKLSRRSIFYDAGSTSAIETGRKMSMDDTLTSQDTFHHGVSNCHSVSWPVAEYEHIHSFIHSVCCCCGGCLKEQSSAFQVYLDCSPPHLQQSPSFFPLGCLLQDCSERCGGWYVADVSQLLLALCLDCLYCGAPFCSVSQVFIWDHVRPEDVENVLHNLILRILAFL